MKRNSGGIQVPKSKAALQNIFALLGIHVRFAKAPDPSNSKVLSCLPQLYEENQQLKWTYILYEKDSEQNTDIVLQIMDQEMGLTLPLNIQNNPCSFFFLSFIYSPALFHSFSFLKILEEWRVSPHTSQTCFHIIVYYHFSQWFCVFQRRQCWKILKPLYTHLLFAYYLL